MYQNETLRSTQKGIDLRTEIKQQMKFLGRPINEQKKPVIFK